MCHSFPARISKANQARVVRDDQMILKRLDGNLPIGSKLQQASGNPMYFSSKLALFDECFDLHSLSGCLRCG